MKYLGVDFGVRKIGLAIGEDGSGIAVPFDVIPGGEDAVQRIAKLCKDEAIDEIVAGIPIPAAHHSDEQLKKTLHFINLLSDAAERPVHVVDEQFSSAEARRVQKEYGATAKEDALAAMLILQAYLDDLVRVT